MGLTLHRVKALPKVGEWVIWEKLAICNTFRDNSDLLILSRWVTSYGSETSPCESVGFLCRKIFSPSIVSSPVFRSFENIILSFKSDHNSFVAACVYRPPGSSTIQFLEDFLALSGFLSSTGSRFIICGDINVHLDVECGDRSRFNHILQCCGLVQSVSGPTHLLGHTLDVLISPCDSDFVRNVSVGDFISDHAAIRCQLDFSRPPTSIDKWSLIVGITGLISTSSTMTSVIYRLYGPLKVLLQNCMIST